METPAKAITFELLLEDYNAMLGFVCAPASTGLWLVERLLWVAAIFGAGFIATVLGGKGGIFLAGMFTAFLLIFVRMLLTRARLQPLPQGAVLCRYHVQLTHAGVHVSTPSWTCDAPWQGILAVEESASHCFLRADKVSAYTIPKRSFESSEALREFMDFAREQVSRAHAARAS